VIELEAMQQLEGLPTKLALPVFAQSAVGEAFERMASDALRPATRAVNALRNVPVAVEIGRQASIASGH
jgi:hypothetical protein